MRKSHTTIMRHPKDKQSKSTSSLFPIEMIAKLQSNAQQNIEQLQNPTMGVTINNESTTTEPYIANNMNPDQTVPINRISLIGVHAQGGYSNFFRIRRLGPSIYPSPPKNIRNFKHPKKIFEILATPKNIPILYLDLKKRP